MSIESINKYLDKCEIYQDIIINSKLYKKGIRSCEDRYKYIKECITIKNRPFTILDIGANFGYYSIKLAQDFPNAYVVMIQNNIEAELLKEICIHNTNINDRLCLLNITANADNMKLLAQCEHFDYILCNNVLHHMNDYKLVYEQLKKMTKYLIIETPPPNDNLSCGQNYLNEIYNLVNKECTYKSNVSFIRHTNSSTYSHMYFYNFGDITFKDVAYYGSILYNRYYKHYITDDIRTFTKKENNNDIVANYIYGINLKTFISLNGIYPLKDNIINRFNKMKINTTYKFNNSIRDINYWNFILNDNINLIDVHNNIDGNNEYNDDIQLNSIIAYLKDNLNK